MRAFCGMGCMADFRSKQTGEESTRRTHGCRGTRLYGIWKGMRSRCSLKQSGVFKRYAGRGISVCEEWASFEPFKNWALVNGYSDSLEIDRINNDGNYSPANCRWVTRAENSMNKSQTKRISGFDGEVSALVLAGMSQKAIARKLNVGASTVFRSWRDTKRKGGGWDAQEVLS